MSYTKVSTLVSQDQVWAKDSINGNPNYRNLTAFRRQVTLTRSRTGDSLPKFRQVIANQGNATTNMSGTFASREGNRYADCKLVYRRPAFNDTVTQEASGNIARYHIGAPAYSGAWTSNAGSRASAQALGKVRDTAVSMSGPTFLGELRETLRMLKKPAAALQDGIERYSADLYHLNRQNRRKYFRKNPKKYSRNLSKIASGLWLEYAFGWVPLLSDIEDALDTYNDLVDFDRTKKFSAGGTDSDVTFSATTTVNMNPPGSFLQYIADINDTEVEVVRYRGAVRMQADSTAHGRLQRFGFTPSEFVPTAWELLPWSFLIDYFANIGDVLNALVTDTSNVIWVSRSVVKRVKRTAFLTLNKKGITATVGTQNVITLYGQPCYVVWKVSTVSRGNVAGIDFPRVAFRLKQSPTHLLNIAALMEQVGIDTHPQRRSKRNYRL